MANDGTVKIGVEVNPNDAKKQLGDLGKNSSSILSGIGDAAKKATIAIGGTATAVAGYALKVGTSFESTMSEVQAISGATGDQMEQLTAKAKEMGASTSFSATEAGEAFTYMAMAGWKTEDMLSGIDGIMNLAAASGENLGTTSDIVTDALTAFGMSASDSGKFADELAAASSNANTNVSMLGESFKYVAPVAGALGFSSADTATALGLMANAGIKAGQAGTALRAGLNALVKPSSDAAAALMDDLGISLTDSKGKTKSLNEVMDNLRDSMGDLSEAEQAKAASTIFGTDAMSGMLAIINASEEDYDKLTEAIYHSAGAAEKMANVRLDNLEGQVTLLKSAVEGFGLVVYEGMVTPLTNLAANAQEAVSGLTTVLQNEGPAAMAACATTMVTTMLATFAARAPEITAQGAQVISGFIESISVNVPRIMTAGVNAIAAFISGIGAQLPTLVPQALQMVVTLADSVISNLPKIVDAGIALITGLVQGVVNSIPLLVTEVPRIINDFWAAFDANAFKLLEAGLSLIKQLGQGILNNLPLIISNAGEIVSAIFNTISHLDLLAAGKALIKNLATGLKAMGPAAKTAVSDISKNLVNTIKNTNWAQLGKTVMTLLKNGIAGMGSALISAAKVIAKGVSGGIKNTNWAQLGKTVMSLLKSGISGMGSALAAAAKAIGQAAFNAIKNINWLNLGKTVINLLISGIRALLSTVASALKSIGKAGMDAFRGLDWKSIGSNVVNGIISGVTGMAGSLFSSLKNLASNALSAAKNALGIHSPSTEFAEIGHYMIAGMINGIEKHKEKVGESLQSMASSAIEATEKAAAGLNDIFGDLITTADDEKIIIRLKGDASELKKTIQALDSTGISAYVERLKAIPLPYIPNLVSIGTGYQGARELYSERSLPEIDKQELKAAMKEGIHEAMDGVEVKIDGKPAGKVLAPYVDKYMPKPAF